MYLLNVKMFKETLNELIAILLLIILLELTIDLCLFTVSLVRLLKIRFEF